MISSEQMPVDLTVGIIVRNGRPFLQHCLASVTRLGQRYRLAVIAVDSGSSDGTTIDLLSWAPSSGCQTTIHRIDGPQNASVARNTILKSASWDSPVFLVDGDVEINLTFVEAALLALGTDSVVAVAGDLEDVWYDSNNAATSSNSRYSIASERSARSTGGIIVVSPRVKHVLQDETLRRNEDIDYALRISSDGELRCLPITMGRHHSRHYYSKLRLRTWIQEQYARPIGSLVRKHLASPTNLFEIARLEKGILVGLAIQLVLLISLAAAWPLGVAISMATLMTEWIRFALKSRPSHFLPTRIVAPWMVVVGFFLSENAPTDYKSQIIYPVE